MGATDDGEAGGGRALPPHRGLTEDVYDAVRELLMDQVIRPGGRASIDGIARRLGVSPTPVREALARLESEGLVTRRALHGYTAADLIDEDGLRDLYQLRGLLEPFAAEAAIPRLAPDDLASLQETVRAMTAPPAMAGAVTESERYREYRTFAENDAAFHRLIAERSGNALLAETLVRLRSHVHLYRLYVSRGIELETVVEHRAILDALETGDRDGARRAMRAHLDQSFARLSARG
jgi:DNA-binding GntR family transcriptional regulator